MFSDWAKDNGSPSRYHLERRVVRGGIPRILLLDMNRRFLTPSIALTLSVFLLTMHCGCVAMNIPSERRGDPTDGGGLFGSWDRKTSIPHTTHPREASEGWEMTAPPCEDAFCQDPFGGPLEIDPFDTSVDSQGTPKAPEVPWPRFHPIPTRPVFGGTL